LGGAELEALEEGSPLGINGLGILAPKRLLVLDQVGVPLVSDAEMPHVNTRDVRGTFRIPERGPKTTENKVF
jgi:hypothetical protein